MQAGAEISATPYYQIKCRYLAAGLATALEERARSGQLPKVAPSLEAKITHLACSSVPTVTARWTFLILLLNYLLLKT